MKSLLQRIFSHIRCGAKSECWPWNGAVNNCGYGMVRHEGQAVCASRLVYKLTRKIPRDMVVDHLCRNRLCCNPAHMEAVTIGENVRRGLRGRMHTHCPRGHQEFGMRNTGRRYCLACERERSRLNRMRMKSERCNK